MYELVKRLRRGQYYERITRLFMSYVLTFIFTIFTISLKGENMNYTLKKLRTFNTVVVDMITFYFIATCLKNASNNDKTGHTIQTYFIDKTRLTTEPKIFGSKCHDCSAVNYCYVTRDKISVRKALKKLINGENTSYKLVTFEHALLAIKYSRMEAIRLGTYGDPSIMGIDHLIAICETKKHLSYTHFWKDEALQDLKKICMASTASMYEDLEAKALGWRTFRVRLTKDAPILPSSIQCLYENKDIQCIKCGLCNGIALDNKRKNVADIWVYGHGASHKKLYGEIKK